MGMPIWNCLNNKEWMPFSKISRLANQNNLDIQISDSADGSESLILMKAQKDAFYPSNYMFYVKYTHKDLNEIEALL